MKKVTIALSLLLVLAMMLGLCACNEEQKPVNFTVSYAAGAGSGTAPAAQTVAEGTEITLAENPFTYEGYTFTGWLAGEQVYKPGDKFTVSADTVFTAQWKENDVIVPPVPPTPKPAFTQAEYAYDRLGGGALELPINLDGANIAYIQVDDKSLAANQWSYDEAKKTIVIAADFALTLSEGEHTVLAVVDVETEAPVSCKLRVEQSVKTSFDEVTTKHFVYGKDAGVTFTVGFNGTTASRLTFADGTEISNDFWTSDGSSITVKTELLSKLSNTSQYRLYLSNNDSYAFTVTSNVIFATDYDMVTVHDTTASNIGHNPLYQYYDNVSIVTGPEGMDGKVLKITPNTVDVTYDCHGYLTLRSPEWDSLWHSVPFTEGKFYVVSFDYMTEGTGAGDFCIKSVNTGWQKELLLGEENDGKLHHFSTIVSAEEIDNGIYIWAKFIGGGGTVYIDNYKLAQLDKAPSLTAGGDHTMGAGEYSLDFDPAGLSYKVLLNGQEISAVYENGKLTLDAEAMKALQSGSHSLEVAFAVTSLQVNIRVLDNRVAEFVTGMGIYDILNKAPLKIYGTFEGGVELVSLKQLVKNHDGGYEGGWEFAHNDTNTNYASLATLVSGNNGQGYLELPVSLLDCLWGQTKFVAEFSNGASREFTVDSFRVPLFTNYDETTLYGYLNGNANPGSPLNSGMWGNAIVNIESRGEGQGNALFIRSTEGAADRCAFTVKFHEHVWDWYKAIGQDGDRYRITFTYQISEKLADKGAYVMIMTLGGVEENFFGSYDSVVPVTDYFEVRYNLIADGQVHTFDSGWFTHDSSLRMTKIVLPDFSAADEAFVMVDDYRIVKSTDIFYPLAGLNEYSLGQAESFSFNIGNQTVESLTVNGQKLLYTCVDGLVSLDKDMLNNMALGSYDLVLKTNEGTYKKTFSIIDNRNAELSVNHMEIVRGQGSALIPGSFNTTLKVTSVTRQGSHAPWDPSVGTPTAMNPAYVTVKENGLELAAALVDQCYGTTGYVVTFDNGKFVAFSLKSNVYYYSNFDETYVFATLGGNSAVCQDAEMWEIVDVNGDHKIKYTPSKAVQGHSVAAINGNGTDNIILTFDNRNVGSYNWWENFFAPGDIITVFFDYETVLNDKESHYSFIWIDKNTGKHLVPLDGSGSFYIELEASNLRGFGINCPAASPDQVEGTYMYVDNFGYAYASDTYLTEHSKNVTYKGGAVTLAGSFPEGLSVVSLKRYGDNFWDSTKTAAGDMNPAYITLGANGMTVSEALINQVYNTEVFWATLSDGTIVRFSLTSNLLHFTNYDETSIHEAVEGNIRSCQDTAMRTLTGADGNNYIEYRPGSAVLGHALGWNTHVMDNRIFTFSNTTLGNHWWWEYELRADSTIIIFFDYEVFAGQKNPAYSFQWMDASGAWHKEALDGSGSFYIEIDANDLVAFGIGCPAASVDEVSDTYMKLDNFGFGYKA